MPPVDPWFPFRQKNPAARVRLFCLPPAGGGATLFREWPQLLPTSFEVCAVQLPGRERRTAESPYANMGPLADAVASVVGPLLELPFAFFGHSMGGLVSFEVARRLTSVGKEPAHLFISAVHAPHWPDPDPVHQLSNDAMIAKLRREEASGFPDEVLANAEFMEFLIPLLRADASVTETYEMDASARTKAFACPLSVFIGTEDKKIPLDAVREWQRYTRASYREIIVPGGHDFIKTEAARITQAIAAAIG
jgi:medium-chain acyl-[acyl-carrier-protein] hydrolase